MLRINGKRGDRTSGQTASYSGTIQPAWRRAVGVTLLEVLLAIGLLGVLLAMLFQFTQTTMQADAVGREMALR